MLIWRFIPKNPVDKLISCSFGKFWHAELIVDGDNSGLADPKKRAEYDTCKTIDKNGITIK